jgi:hypothetical protein
VNEKGKVLDSAGHRDRQYNNVGAYRLHNGLNQQWDIVYADEMPSPPKRGELNTDFNLFVERPFYVVSGLPRKRYLDLIGRRMVIKTPATNRQTQLWWFDQKTKTIKNW